MVEAADPRDGALDAHAEAGVRDGAVAAQVEVPLEGVERQVVLFDALLQQVVGVDALRAADDLAVAFGREHVDAERLGGVERVGLHVEGLDGGGVAVDHDRAGRTGWRCRSRRASRSRRRSCAGFRSGPSAKASSSIGVGFVVADPAGTAPCDGASSLATSRPMTFRSARWCFEHARDDVGEEVFGELHRLVEVA